MAGTSRSRNLFGEAFRSFRLDRRQPRKGAQHAATADPRRGIARGASGADNLHGEHVQ